MLNVLKSIKNIFKNLLSSTFKTFGSDELDSLKIALVTSLIVSATKNCLNQEQAENLSIQIVGLVDGLSNNIAEELK